MPHTYWVIYIQITKVTAVVTFKRYNYNPILDVVMSQWTSSWTSFQDKVSQQVPYLMLWAQNWDVSDEGQMNESENVMKKWYCNSPVRISWRTTFHKMFGIQIFKMLKIG